MQLYCVVFVICVLTICMQLCCGSLIAGLNLSNGFDYGRRGMLLIESHQVVHTHLQCRYFITISVGSSYFIPIFDQEIIHTSRYFISVGCSYPYPSLKLVHTHLQPWFFIAWPGKQRTNGSSRMKSSESKIQYLKTVYWIKLMSLF